MSRAYRTFALAFVAWASAGLALAQTPQVATYQGRLQENGLPVNGVRYVEIRLCNTPDSATLPNNCYPTPMSAIQGVNVINGVFKATFTVPTSLDLSANAWYLEVAVGIDTGQMNTLAPREQLTSVPYALYAAKATNLTGTLNAGQLSVGAINIQVLGQTFSNSPILTAWLADAAVDSSKLAAGAVDSTKILDSGVQTSKLGADAVITAKILDGAVQTSKLARDAVDSSKILDGAVTSSKLAPGAVQAAGVAAGTLDTTKLALDAVTNAKILNATIQTSKLAADAVATAAILNAAVTNPKILDATIQTSKLAADAVVTASILSAAVTNAKILDATIQTSKLAADAVTAAAIQGAAVQTAKLAADAVVTAAIRNGAITATKFAAGAMLVGAVQGGDGVDRLGVMTRMGAVKITVGAPDGQISINLDSRMHTEIYFFAPSLAVATNLTIDFNGGAFGGAYAVTRSTYILLGATGGFGFGGESGVSSIGFLQPTGGATFPVNSQVHLRLTLDGNTGSPSVVSGSYQATAFDPLTTTVTMIQGSFAVTTGAPVTAVRVTAGGSALPAGSYLAAYGEDFP